MNQTAKSSKANAKPSNNSIPASSKNVNKKTDTSQPEILNKRKTTEREVSANDSISDSSENVNTKERNSIKNRIRSDMTEEERYELLKDRILPVVSYNAERMADVDVNE